MAAALRAMAETVTAHRDELVELDRAVGDGDHGVNLERGFAAVVTGLDEATASTPGAVLKEAASTLISHVGGAAGPLYGTAFLRAAAAIGDVSTVDVARVAPALRAALDGVRARGKAVGGDATMVDALIPAVAAAEAATQDEDPRLATVLADAADAADVGAESTVGLVARKGRASYLGERAIGHCDPGARSTALLLRALAEVAR